jgi:hypothetical protein
LISPVVAFMKRARTKIGAEKVMSFSLHSSTENLGGGLKSSSFGSNSNSSWSVSVIEAVTLDGDEIRQCQDLVEVGERVTVPDGGTSGQEPTPQGATELTGAVARAVEVSGDRWSEARRTATGDRTYERANRQPLRRGPSEGPAGLAAG